MLSADTMGMLLQQLHRLVDDARGSGRLESLHAAAAVIQDNAEQFGLTLPPGPSPLWTKLYETSESDNAQTHARARLLRYFDRCYALGGNNTSLALSRSCLQRLGESCQQRPSPSVCSRSRYLLTAQERQHPRSGTASHDSHQFLRGDHITGKHQRLSLPSERRSGQVRRSTAPSGDEAKQRPLPVHHKG
ncbi:hypothetical protein CSUI_002744 [Cystoisospora suis]|uniref:Uncharacterized protein n=1 Tax=Cystoisospora suis TaxID=483139 RepID=A0A2C6L7K4_9APIC|nr:hypothetical protein CSUI_002744 [Cystoisospora suis]